VCCSRLFFFRYDRPWFFIPHDISRSVLDSIRLPFRLVRIGRLHASFSAVSFSFLFVLYFYSSLLCVCVYLIHDYGGTTIEAIEDTPERLTHTNTKSITRWMGWIFIFLSGRSTRLWAPPAIQQCVSSLNSLQGKTMYRKPRSTTTTTPTVSLVLLFFLLFLDVHNNVIGIGA
jgi:hypothetical protein